MRGDTCGTYIRKWAFEIWRRDPELNRGTRFCRPLPNHSAIAPRLFTVASGCFPGGLRKAFLAPFPTQSLQLLPMLLSHINLSYVSN